MTVRSIDGRDGRSHSALQTVHSLFWLSKPTQSSFLHGRLISIGPPYTAVMTREVKTKRRIKGVYSRFSRQIIAGKTDSVRYLSTY